MSPLLYPTELRARNARKVARSVAAANAIPPLLGGDARVSFVLMIAVVTGSSGFIGSHVVDALLARGATVRVLRRPESPASHDPRVAHWTADLLDDRSVRESPIWKDVTHVFHAGGVTKRRTLAEFRYGNVVPSTNILSALVPRGRPVPRFGDLSSQAAAGRAP